MSGFGPSVAHGRCFVGLRCVQVTKNRAGSCSLRDAIGRSLCGLSATGYKNRRQGKSRGVLFDSKRSIICAVRCALRRTLMLSRRSSSSYFECLLAIATLISLFCMHGSGCSYFNCEVGKNGYLTGTVFARSSAKVTNLSASWHLENKLEQVSFWPLPFVHTLGCTRAAIVKRWNLITLISISKRYGPPMPPSHIKPITFGNELPTYEASTVQITSLVVAMAVNKLLKVCCSPFICFSS